jgi:hypothetical protein
MCSVQIQRQHSSTIAGRGRYSDDILVPVDALLIALNTDAPFVQQVIEVRDRFACRHDEIPVVDPALEQRRKYINGSFRFSAVSLEFFETLEVLCNQCIKALMRTAEGLAMCG